MTDDDFRSELLVLSPKISSLVAGPGGDSIKSQLGSLAVAATGAPDLDSALGAVKADAAKLAALEDRVAAQVKMVAANVQPPAAGPGGSPPTQPAAATPIAAVPSLTPLALGAQSPASMPIQQAPSGAPSPPAWMPPIGQMWVGPTVSLAVIGGFFVMLSILLYLEMHRSSLAADYIAAQTAAMDEATKAAADADAAKQAADKKVDNLKSEKTPDSTAIKVAEVDAAAKDTAAKAAAAKLASAKAATAIPVESNATPTGLQNVLFTLLGALGAAFTQVVNYWLGSSKGSADKTTFLANSVPLQAQSQP